jgi:hypothetical protein
MFVCVLPAQRFPDHEIVRSSSRLRVTGVLTVTSAFILFRQHQQASIIAQNPGIPNPEVSKIIGEQWRGLTAKAKEEWNLLAEVRRNKDFYHFLHTKTLVF